MTELDKIFMQRCLDLAKLGQGSVAPNPMVGSVIVHNNKIIGEGYHQQYGQAHAEVNAVNAVKDKSLLMESTIYINLEPCAHHGKTPPCADLIIANKIPNVKIGCIDSFAKVAGNGIKKLEAAGAKVEVGILEEESLALNKRFFTFHASKRPYIILKWAETEDGFMDMDRSKNKKGIFWITSPEMKTLVHKWRHEESAILVGNNTIVTDNPQLNCRDYAGVSPIRIVIDENLKLDYGAFNVGDRSVLTYIITKKKVIASGNLQFVQPKSFALNDIMTLLYELNIQSVIIEGGKFTLEKFILDNLWDEARVLTGNKMLQKGIKAPSLNRKSSLSYAYFSNKVNIFTNV